MHLAAQNTRFLALSSHSRSKLYPDVDFYPSILRVFCTLLDAMLTSFAQCTRPHKHALFRASRSFSHPLAAKAHCRPRPKPLRNCARNLFRFHVFTYFQRRPQNAISLLSTSSTPVRRTFDAVQATAERDFHQSSTPLRRTCFPLLSQT